MAEIEPKEFIKADYKKFEKINNDYFVKVIPVSSEGEFVPPNTADNPLSVNTNKLIKIVNGDNIEYLVIAKIDRIEIINDVHLDIYLSADERDLTFATKTARDEAVTLLLGLY